MKVLIKKDGELFLILRDIVKIRLHATYASFTGKHGYIAGIFSEEGITCEASLEV